MTFNELGLEPEILNALEELGFEYPTPIQEKTIPYILNTETDIVALAQTGTGKTAAFGLPIIQKIDIKPDIVQTLVLCPTRELCVQIANDLISFSKYITKLNVVAVYGGTSIQAQLQSLKNGTQIVVGTPGRVIDLIRRKALKIKNIKWLVLDEADEMLNMGFKEDLDTILAETPVEKHTYLFSATMPSEIAEIACKYMHKPKEITVGKRNSGADSVKSEYYMVNAKDRYETLKRIADINPNIYGIVFCRTRKETKEIADKLINDGYNADALHGDLSQAQRDYVMNRFRIKQLQLLIATDVAARGLDVNDLTHVINYNLPDNLESYIHRSGRTGRAGKKGIAISIIHTRERNRIKELERMTRQKFEQKMVPLGQEICEKQLFNLIDKVEKIEVNESQIEQYLPGIYKKLSWLSREDLIQHFVSAEFNRFLSYYKNAPDLNLLAKGRRERGINSRNNVNFSRLFINIGSVDDLNPAVLIGLINNHSNSREIEIGKIDIMKKFSFFDINRNFEGEVISSLTNVMYKNIRIVVEVSKPIPKKDFRRGRDKKVRRRGMN